VRQSRDQSEEIALGVPLTTRAVDDEFDGQLFGRSGGVGAACDGGDESYQVYDERLFPERRRYVPLAGGREAPRLGEASGGAEAAGVKFTRGERQVPDGRAGVFYPEKEREGA